MFDEILITFGIDIVNGKILVCVCTGIDTFQNSVLHAYFFYAKYTLNELKLGYSSCAK